MERKQYRNQKGKKEEHKIIKGNENGAW